MTGNDHKKIIIGTRGSRLALYQANWVRDRLAEAFPGQNCELRVIKTRGDKILDTPLARIGGKGLFVKEIEEALLNREIDLAVHSMKDMPSEIPAGLCLGAVPVRENPHDALISADNAVLAALPRGARVGTSSLRRASQLSRRRPDIRIVPLRGNVDTRLAKLKNNEMEAIILAAAGLTRLGLESHITEYLDKDIMLPAVAQGALGIEIRSDDAVLRSLVEPLNHAGTMITTTAERAFLQRLEGGCQVPVAGMAVIEQQTLVMEGLVADISGATMIRDSITGPAASAAELGRELADRLLDNGGREILNALMDSCLKDSLPRV